MNAHEAHRREAGSRKLGLSVITVSTSRYSKLAAGEKFEDESGDAAQRMVEKRGHSVLRRELIGDDSALLRGALASSLEDSRIDVVLFAGGTGVSPTDVTIETIRPMFEKEIEGFGELLRQKSYRRIGTPAILTRATAGVVKERLVLCLPGSPDGVKTALRFFLPEMAHVLHVARGK